MSTRATVQIDTDTLRLQAFVIESVAGEAARIIESYRNFLSQCTQFSEEERGKLAAGLVVLVNNQDGMTILRTLATRMRDGANKADQEHVGTQQRRAERKEKKVKGGFTAAGGFPDAAAFFGQANAGNAGVGAGGGTLPAGVPPPPPPPMAPFGSMPQPPSPPGVPLTAPPQPIPPPGVPGVPPSVPQVAPPPPGQPVVTDNSASPQVFEPPPVTQTFAVPVQAPQPGPPITYAAPPPPAGPLPGPPPVQAPPISNGAPISSADNIGEAPLANKDF